MLLQLEKASVPNTYIDTIGQTVLSQKCANLVKKNHQDFNGDNKITSSPDNKIKVLREK